MSSWICVLLLASVSGQIAADSEDTQAKQRLLNAHQAYKKFRGFLQTEAYEKALQELDRIPEDLHGSFRLHFLRGKTLYDLRRYAESYQELMASERSREQVSPLLFHQLRARCALKADQPEQALRDLAKFSSLRSGGTDDAYWIAGLIRERCGSSGGATELFEQAQNDKSIGSICLLWQGIVAYLDKEYGDAETGLTRFLLRKPHNDRGLYWRCKTRIKRGNTPGAVEDYARLLRKHPIYAGGFDLEETLDTILEPEDLSDGRRQVEKLLEDRPRMGTCFESANPLHVWSAVRFEKKYNNAPVRWDPWYPVEQDAPAYHRYSSLNGAWCIHVSSTYRTGENLGRKHTSDELWYSVLFELENVANQPKANRLRERAQRQSISRREFVLGILKLEYEAALRTRAFVVHVYYPWCVKQQVSPSLAEWRIAGWLTFDDFVLLHPENESQRWNLYGQQYDALRKMGTDEGS